VAISGDQFKSAMSCWSSGVAIVTTRAGERVHGMTVSDFSGASLSPPLVTVCASRDSLTTQMIAEGGCFAVNVLEVGQEALSNRFASKREEMRRFEGVETRQERTGAPLLSGCIANLDCSLVATYEAGDHVIYLGQVEAALVRDGEPLLYNGGRYGRFAASPPKA
jgi:flavin reductase (DIM6/NTAB) family NADH-FMN oxidoreductase RutF